MPRFFKNKFSSLEPAEINVQMQCMGYMLVYIKVMKEEKNNKGTYNNKL